jgi:hypothetical protein
MAHSEEDSVHYSEEEEDDLWEKPAWAKGGVKLKSTGKANAMKKYGNLAAPITFTTFKNEDHTNYVASPDRLYTIEEGEKMKNDGNLAAPITFIRDELKKQKRKSSCQW